MLKIALQTLGCKLNQAETESLASQLLNNGYMLVDSPEDADVYVINTCTVTHIADRKSRHLLRAAHRANPGAMIIAVGCYAMRAPQDLRQLGIVDITVHDGERHNLVEILENRLGQKGKSKIQHQGRTRSLIKIQEGCDDFCSFCIVPYTRGRERCLPLEIVIRDVREKISTGYKEITLTGTKIGAYNQTGQNPVGLESLVEEILKEKGLMRLRLSSLKPQDFNIGLVKLWNDERLCPHIHVPLQSGCQDILQKMGRRYSIDEYERTISTVREAIPDLAITTDIIVGFPGEGEKEFEESYSFCEKMGFAAIHVFPYSTRSGTKAAKMSAKVKEEIKKERCQRMLALAHKSSVDFKRQFVGRTMNVLWENKSAKGEWNGMTPNYIRVFTTSSRDLTNTIVPVKLVAEHPQGLLGELTNGGKE